MALEKVTERTPTDWKALGMQWLVNQGASTVLLVILVAMIGYISDYGIKVAIPAHIKSIQEGYDRHVADHRKEVESMHASYERSLKLVTDAFSREMDMMRESSRRLNSSDK